MKDLCLRLLPATLLAVAHAQPTQSKAGSEEGLSKVDSHLNGVRFRPTNSPSGIVCEYPDLRYWEPCNSAGDRSCWMRSTMDNSTWDVRTNYEYRWPQGITREYYLEVTEQPLSPDGYVKPRGLVVNGSYPGPVIEACWGDELVIHVTNRLAQNGTTIHYHGVRQWHVSQCSLSLTWNKCSPAITDESDGRRERGKSGVERNVSPFAKLMRGVQVTQCPIAQNDTFTHRWRALQYGNTWYHSHYSLQYADGLAGPLLLHGPHSAPWDIAWDQSMLSSPAPVAGTYVTLTLCYPSTHLGLGPS